MAFCDLQLASKRILICALMRETGYAFHYTSIPGHSVCTVYHFYYTMYFQIPR